MTTESYLYFLTINHCFSTFGNWLPLRDELCAIDMFAFCPLVLFADIYKNYCIIIIIIIIIIITTYIRLCAHDETAFIITITMMISILFFFFFYFPDKQNSPKKELFLNLKVKKIEILHLIEMNLIHLQNQTSTICSKCL